LPVIMVEPPLLPEAPVAHALDEIHELARSAS
jgi:hypothetical protein